MSLVNNLIILKLQRTHITPQHRAEFEQNKGVRPVF